MPSKAPHTSSTIPLDAARTDCRDAWRASAKAGLAKALPWCMLLLLLAFVGCRRPEAAAEKRVRAAMVKRAANMEYQGIDVSSHQRVIDWDSVSTDSSITFVYIKATEGATYRSPHYSDNLHGARRHGLKAGSYHFLRSTSTIAAQFRNFIATAKRDEQDLVPMIDVETRGTWSRQQLIDSLGMLATLMEDYYGVRPMIYSTMSFYNRNLSPYFNNYPLYIGRYSNKSPEISWNGRYTIWQFSETGKVPGIGTDVDLCRFSPTTGLSDITLPRR